MKLTSTSCISIEAMNLSNLMCTFTFVSLIFALRNAINCDYSPALSDAIAAIQNTYVVVRGQIFVQQLVLQITTGKGMGCTRRIFLRVSISHPELLKSLKQDWWPVAICKTSCCTKICPLQQRDHNICILYSGNCEQR